jgi:hypothetical protein
MHETSILFIRLQHHRTAVNGDTSVLFSRRFEYFFHAKSRSRTPWCSRRCGCGHFAASMKSLIPPYAGRKRVHRLGRRTPAWLSLGVPPTRALKTAFSALDVQKDSRSTMMDLEDSFLRSGRSEGFEEHHDGPPTVSRFLHLRDEVRHQYLPSAKPMILLEASVGRRYPIPRGVSTNAPSSTI